MCPTRSSRPADAAHPAYTQPMALDHQPGEHAGRAGIMRLHGLTSQQFAEEQLARQDVRCRPRSSSSSPCTSTRSACSTMASTSLLIPGCCARFHSPTHPPRPCMLAPTPPCMLAPTHPGHACLHPHRYYSAGPRGLRADWCTFGCLLCAYSGFRHPQSMHPQSRHPQSMHPQSMHHGGGHQ